MNLPRGYSLLVEPDQWAACEHDGTRPLAGGGVELDWKDDESTGSACFDRPSGLAFDRLCRAYRSRPAEHRVEAIAEDSRRSDGCPGPFGRPLGLAFDDASRLYVADAAERAVWVIDTANRRLLRRTTVCGDPIDVATHCSGVVVLAIGSRYLYTIEGRRDPAPYALLERPCYPGGLEPLRIAPGPIILWRNQNGECVVAKPDGVVLQEMVSVTDIDVSADGAVVVAARKPGRSFARYSVSGVRWTEMEPVGAPDYDGGAVVFDGRGRIGYTTEKGYRWTIGSVADHVPEGRVISGRMESNAYRTRWGRAFFDACLPPATKAQVRFWTTDDDTIATPQFDSDAKYHLLYRRPTGSELPWAADADRWETYEAPVDAPRGRYLWVELMLTGTARITPRVAAIRVERPGHALLESLPQAFSRDENNAGLLHRFLAPPEAILYELGRKSDERAAYVDPATVPRDAMAWLASFAGLVLDTRWPESAHRKLIAEVYTLFRHRGTSRGLSRMLEIYLGFEPQIIEQWQIRGLGGSLGSANVGVSAAAIGARRQSGTLGRFTLDGGKIDPTAYSAAAHRFTVLIRGHLSSEQRQVVCDIIDVNRPAHTMFGVQELGNGMRAGTLRVGLTSYVGPAADWVQFRLGDSRVGANGLVGKAALGSRLGADSVAGRVRVG
jgi:phage tail-like protein